MKNDNQEALEKTHGEWDPEADSWRTREEAGLSPQELAPRGSENEGCFPVLTVK